MTNKFDLYSFRKAMGLSQAEMGDAFGVGRTAYQQWEREGAPLWIHLACTGYAATRVFAQLRTPFKSEDLIYARNQLGLKQTELAEALFISRATVSRWENGTPPAWVSFAMITLTFNQASQW